jgi:YggT family protein
MLDALFRALLQVVDLLLTIYVWLIIARAILSWINPSPYHPVVRFLYKATEPVLRPIRRILPPIYGLDLSPILVIFLIYFIKDLIFRFTFRF